MAHVATATLIGRIPSLLEQHIVNIIMRVTASGGWGACAKCASMQHARVRRFTGTTLRQCL